MPSMPDRAKVAALRAAGAFNERHGRVRDPQFRVGGFFDPRDLVQVKYEMLRRVGERQAGVGEIATAFGFSRIRYYQVRRDFQRDGLRGLLPRRHGPKRAHKLTAEVMAFVAERLAADPPPPAQALLSAIEERFGRRVHLRSLQRALARGKKNA